MSNFTLSESFVQKQAKKSKIRRRIQGKKLKMSLRTLISLQFYLFLSLTRCNDFQRRDILEALKIDIEKFGASLQDMKKLICNYKQKHKMLTVSVLNLPMHDLSLRKILSITEKLKSGMCQTRSSK